ncbi:MAG: hypothetical protein R3B72_51300 [Polyangiaceae bacterium]
MTITVRTSVDYDPQGAPRALPPSGTVTQLTEAEGVVALTLAPSRAVLEEIALLTTLRGELAPSALASVSAGVAPVVGGYLVGVVEEGPGGATPAERPFTLAALGRSGYGEASLWAAGSLLVGPSGPAWLWQSGAFREPLPVEAGRVDLRWWPGQGIGAADTSVLVTARGVLEDGQLSAAAATMTEDGAIRITTGRFGSTDGSALETLAVDVLVLGPPRTSALELYGFGALRVEQTGPIWAHQSGIFGAVTAEGPGAWLVELGSGYGAADYGSVIVASPHGLGASLRSVAVEHVSPTTKRLTLLEQTETNRGGARADFDVDLAIVTPVGPVPPPSP